MRHPPIPSRPPQSDPPRGSPGMTLIEVLLATAILSVGLAMLLTAASRCLAVIRAAKTYQTARWTLSLGELEHPYNPSPTNKVEDFEVDAYEPEPGNGFQFSRTVDDEAAEDTDGLRVIHTKVKWESRGHEAFEETVRYVYLPKKDD